MNEAIEQISDFVKGRTDEVQARFERLENESRDRWNEFTERGRKQGDDTRKKLDDLIGSLKKTDVRAQVEDLRDDLLEVFGLATQEEVARLRVEVAALEEVYFSPEMSDYHTPKCILVQVFATILGCLLLLSMVLGGEVYILDHPIYCTILAFIAVNFISLFQAHNIYQGLYSLWIQVCLFLVAILCFHCIQSRQQVHAHSGCMIFAA